ncbi:lipoyl(octanoyl) transferase LipB, partial [Candidatus Nanopelagicales bacterium]|nr:lipoyl(octanoyl) transferase LipB [Candidatus Nanopelagicales bacterium]
MHAAAGQMIIQPRDQAAVVDPLRPLPEPGLQIHDLSTQPSAPSPLTGEPMCIYRLPLGSGGVDYNDAWQLQRQLHAAVSAAERPNTLLLLEHQEVYTAGSRTQTGDLPTDNSQVIDVDRGGRITWHGPGQLVGYPIVRLPHKLDVLAYVRALEDLIMHVLTQFGVSGCRIEQRSGVWVTDDRPNAQPCKVAAIGVRVAQGVTMHGFAINSDCDLDWADQIVPCGITDAGVTSLTLEAGTRVTTRQAADAV